MFFNYVLQILLIVIYETDPFGVKIEITNVTIEN